MKSAFLKTIFDVDFFCVTSNRLLKTFSLSIAILISCFPLFAQQLPQRDLSFGKNGASWLNLMDSATEIESVTDMDIDNAGNTYVIGFRGYFNYYEEQFIAKINAEGKLDSSFNEKGFREIGFGIPYNRATDPGFHPGQFVRVNSDQSKIWIIRTSFGKNNFVTTRLLMNGTNDTSYGHNGYKTGDLGLRPFGVDEVIMTKDNGFLLLGTYTPYGSSVKETDSLRVIKLTADGEIDSAYNGGLALSISFIRNLLYQKAILLTDQSLLITVNYRSGSYDSVALCKINALGKLDATFGNNGIARGRIYAANVPITIKTTLLADGSVSVIPFNPETSYVPHLKFTAAGLPDTTFGIDGMKVYTTIRNLPSYIFNRAKDPYDLKIWGYKSPFYETEKGGYFVQLNLFPDGELNQTVRQVPASSITDGILTGPPSPYPQDQELNFQSANDKFVYITRPNYTRRSAASFKIGKVNDQLQRDSSYGINGAALVPMNTNRDNILLLQPLSSGKLIAEVFIRGGKSDFVIALTCFTKKGTIDSSFGNKGFLFSTDSTLIVDMTVDNYDRIITYTQPTLNTHNTQVYSSLRRYMQNGSLDSSFGLNGIVDLSKINLKGVIQFKKIAVQPDNKIIALTEMNTPDYKRDRDIGVLRFNEDGSIDNSFGINGRVNIDLFIDFVNPSPFFTAQDIAKNFTALKDTTIAVVGSFTDASQSYIFRLDKNGKIIRKGPENGRFWSQGNYQDAETFFMKESDSGNIVVGTKETLDRGQLTGHSVGAVSYSKDLMNYTPFYSGYYTEKDILFTGTTMMHNENLILCALQYNNTLDSYNILSICLPRRRQDTTYGNNGILTFKDVLPDTSTLLRNYYDGVLIALSAIDNEGQLYTVASPKRNYSEDIFITKNLLYDTVAASTPKIPTLSVTPICNEGKAILLANSPDCSRCAYTWNTGETGKSISVYKEGTYNVTVTNPAGSVSASKVVTLSKTPVISIVNSATNVCEGAEIVLTATGAAEYNWQGPGLIDNTSSSVTAKPVANAEYIVTGKQNGCSSSDSVGIKVISSVVPLVSISYTGCPSDTIVFQAISKNGGDNPRYEWFLNNVAAKTGQGIVLSGLQNGDKVTCVLTSNGECVNPDTSSSTVILNCIRPSSPRIGSLDYFTISPNPTSDFIKIHFALAQQEMMTFALYDINGRPIYSSSNLYARGKFSLQIDMQSFQSGIYFLKVTAGSEKFIRKILKTN